LRWLQVDNELDFRAPLGPVANQILFVGLSARHRIFVLASVPKVTEVPQKHKGWKVKLDFGIREPCLPWRLPMEISIGCA
jgi:hypothetical protein